jgi:DHA1 family multidrug resistance protein-like MFS transporter
MTSSEMASGSWKKSLYAVFIAQLFVMSGFSFAFPFMPLYIEKLGNFTNQQAAFWAGIAAGGAGVAMFFSAPLWGILADRVGRKPMVLRSMFGCAIVVVFMALVPNVPLLITMRFIQGTLSGVMAAASALVASITPRDKAPFAMGLLMVAAYVGNSVGPLIGGVAADNLGYKTTFFITAACLAIGGLIVLFLAKEKFEPPQKAERASVSGMLRLAGSRRVLPLLIVQFSLQAGPNMAAPIIPLFMQQLNPLGQAATAAGIALTLAGVIAALSAIVAGRLAKSISLKTILAFSCLGTCLAYVTPMLAKNVTQLTAFVALTGLVNGGIMTSSYAILSLSVLPSQQGIIFGVGQSANALGFGLGPSIGGALASSLGLKYVFGFAAGVYLLAGLLVIKALPKHAGQTS